MKRGLIVLGLLVCMFCLTSTDIINAQGASIKVGLLAPITGMQPDWGKKQVVGMEMALEAVNRRGGVNGVPLAAEILDTGADAETALSAYQELADRGALVIIGPLFSGCFKGLSDATSSVKLAVIATASATPGLSDLQKNPYAFRMTVTSEKKEEPLMKAWASAHGIKTVSVVYDEKTTVTRAMGVKVWPEVMGRLNITDLSKPDPITITPQTEDYGAQIDRIEALKADGICIAAMPREAGKLIREIRDRGLTQPILGASTTANPKVIEIAGGAAEGLWSVTLFYPGDPNPKVQRYVKEFGQRCRERYPDMNCVPEQYDMVAHDILLFLADIMKKRGITGDPAHLAEERDTVREGLATMGIWRGTAGMMAFDKKGDGIRTAHVVKVENGHWQRAD